MNNEDINQQNTTKPPKQSDELTKKPKPRPLSPEEQEQAKKLDTEVYKKVDSNNPLPL